MQENYALTCSSVKDAEPVILDAFDSMKDKDSRFERDTACKSLSGLMLYGRREFVWQIPGGPLVLGATWCDEKRQEVGENPAGIFSSSFPHEIAHVIQHCDTKMKAGPGDYDDDHGGWTAIGLNKILSDFEDMK